MTKNDNAGNAMKCSPNRSRSIFAVALAVFLVSPLDDIALSTLFGGAVFGFGSTAFYALLIASSTVSVLVWKRQTLIARLRRFWYFSVQKQATDKQLKIRV